MKVILIFATSALLLCQAHGQVQRPSQEHFSGTSGRPMGSRLINGQNTNDNNGIFLSGATPTPLGAGNSLPSLLNGAVAEGHSGFGPFSPFYSGVGSPLYGAAFNPLYGGAALAHSHYGGPLSSVPGLVNPVLPGLLPGAGLLPYSNALGVTAGLNPFSLLSKSYGSTYGLPPFSSPFGINPLSSYALKSSPLNAFPSNYGLHTYPFGVSSAYQGLHTSPFGLSSAYQGLHTSPFGLSSAYKGLHTSPFGLSSAYKGLHTSPFGLSSAYKGLHTSPFGLSSAYQGLHSPLLG